MKGIEPALQSWEQLGREKGVRYVLISLDRRPVVLAMRKGPPKPLD